MNDADMRIRAAVAGDADALAALLGEHGPEVERSLSIAREWRSVLEPADVMQVTYLEAFLEVQRYDADRAQSFRAGLQRIAENLRRAVEAHDFRHGEGQPLGRVTISGGVACFPEDARSALDLQRAADRALYKAKAAGRNRIVGADKGYLT